MSDSPMSDDELIASLVATFREEARELLGDMESALMELEERPEDGELIARAFRALHTIKGNSAMFGLESLEAFAHDLEHLFDLLRKKAMPVTQEIVGIALGAKDRLLALLEPDGDSDDERSQRAEYRAQIAGIVRTRAASAASSALRAEAPPPPAPAPAGERSSTWRILFRPAPGLFAGGTDPLVVFDELRSMGPCSVTASPGAVPPLEAIDPVACYLAWEILLETARPLQEIRDTFIFVGGDAAVEIAPAAGAVKPPGGVATAPQGSGAPGAGAAAPGPGADSRPSSEPGEREACAPGADAVLRRAADQSSTLRVGVARLDKLVDLVGELVTVQARLSRLATLREDAELLAAAEEVERLTAELREQSLSVRMVSIGPAFSRFRRLVRDLSLETGRDVDFATEGEGTELDKGMIDRLNDPIVHLLRNSIDHGIEPVAERARAGKPPRGRVRLSADHAGTSVVIRVEDDGAGIDAEAVRRKAVARGLIAEGDQRSEAELHQLMFLPGFSTSDRVTTISGRGVGLDVVKRAVESLRGQVRVESRRGVGTTFEIRIPLTLAIIEGFEVVLGGEHLILPLAAVRECVELLTRPGERARERSLAEIRGELVPYVRLREWFSVPGEAPPREQIVVTEAEGRRVGIVVDRVVGGQQTVVKPLGRLYREVPGIAGATILGDGTVALILDVARLIRDIEGDGAGPAGAP